MPRCYLQIKECQCLLGNAGNDAREPARAITPKQVVEDYPRLPSESRSPREKLPRSSNDGFVPSYFEQLAVVLSHVGIN